MGTLKYPSLFKVLIFNQILTCLLAIFTQTFVCLENMKPLITHSEKSTNVFCNILIILTKEENQVNNI
nr:hypothetical protein [Mucilaginibacter sp. X5P1]